MPLNPEQSHVFDIYERLFAEEGWKELVGDLKDRISSTKDQIFAGQTNERDLYKAKGIIQAWSYIVNLEQLMESAKRSANEQTPGDLNADS